VNLEHYLVLNRWLFRRLGADTIEDLKSDLLNPEPSAAGESPYLRSLLEREQVLVPEDRLRAYDARVQEYESRLVEHRGSFSWKYFQYLALLQCEILLDALTEDPAALRRSLNDHLADLRDSNSHLADVPDFEGPDLRRLAFFMATGSGKTLLLHAHLWQVFHYLEQGRCPEALVERRDGRREFDNVILITPSEGLSHQHLREFRRSGIDAIHLSYEEPSGWLFGPQVRVIEISKLVDEVSGDGLSIPLESLGSRNLVFVDEGHKGVGSDAREWKRRQLALSREGLLFEYSATFAQSVAAAPPRSRKGLLAEYGKSIVFDYSYRHFYNDGYGKHFEVLNLEADESERAEELLVGGLLTFYQQQRLFRTTRSALHPFQIEPPLWVFLGAGVVKTGKRDLSDVATVVAFLRRFLEDPDWASSWMARILEGRSGFSGAEGDDLFAERLEGLAGTDPGHLYEEVLEDLFHGAGGLEVWELKRADGELGLRTTEPGPDGPRYFGIINVGDPGALRRHLERTLDLEVKADEFTPSLFPEIEHEGSPINILVGSRKFIEGWSSWRVSSMGLLNMGRGEGPQVIQLFGRGVRLKGRGWTLQRSTGPGSEEGDLPDGLAHLETLYIFGWNADYVQAFQRMMTAEEIGWELEVPTLPLFDSAPTLYVPRPAQSDAASAESWPLESVHIHVEVNLVPRITLLSGDAMEEGTAGAETVLDFSNPQTLALLDLDQLYLRLLEYKVRRGYENLLIAKSAIPAILGHADVRMLREEASSPKRVQEGAYRGATAYMDRFVAVREREAESRVMKPHAVGVREVTRRPYRVRGTDPELKRQIEALIRDRDALLSTGDQPLPRLHVDRHLFAPLLLDPKTTDLELTISPAGLNAEEARFLKDLVEFWDGCHDAAGFRDAELFLLRNLPISGVGFFRRSGFYPDFILWVERPGRSLVHFIEPHGLHHGGLAGNAPKIEALKELERLSEEAAFRDLSLRMSGYIVTETKRSDIPDAEGRSWAELKSEYRILSRQSEGYVGDILEEKAD
jgi:hypothetical protein